ncbi:MAG TPA: DUF3105 domain-containing protein, partial [Verrucomicrobiae bacterium]|nr:DUF3105 domain-containing protein [Verrucomicrobiae bacterium]
ILIFVLAIGLALGLGFILFQSSKPENQKQYGEPYEIQGQQHIPEGSTDHPPYNSNPPTSGWHWPQPARCLAYTDTQADEKLIHNLEHGGIWISYKPDVDQQTKDSLNDFVRRYANVLVEPRAANDSNIAVAAWGRLLKLERYEESRIIEFIEAYMDKGPEKVSCAK